jgi:hypothetical protein
MDRLRVSPDSPQTPICASSACPFRGRISSWQVAELPRSAGTGTSDLRCSSAGFARARSACSERGCCSAGLAGGDQLICGVDDESATGRVGERNPVGVDVAQGDPRRRVSAFPVVDGPLGADQPPVVFASQTRSQRLPPSRAATQATGRRATVPGIRSSDRNKPTSLAMRDNLWTSRADGSLPPHVHKDVGAAWRSADSTSIRRVIPPAEFASLNTTTEELARVMADRLAARVNAGAFDEAARGLAGIAVTLRESHVAWATYERTL